MPNHRLVKRLRRLVDRGNALTAELLAHMGEVDGRRLYLEAACPSMFVYCTDILRMSEAQTYRRIGAARLARKFPSVLPMVHSGQLHLCALALLAPHMTKDNGEELLQQAVHLTKRQVEKLIARRFPLRPVPDRVRKLPRRAAGRTDGAGKASSVVEPLLQHASSGPAQPPAGAAQPTDKGRDQGRFEPTLMVEQRDTASRGSATTSRQPRDRVSPLSGESYKIQLTAGQPLHDKLRQAQELLGHQVSDGDLATVFERALDVLLPQLRKQRFAELSKPRKSSAPRKSATPSQVEAPKDSNTCDANREENTRDETSSDVATRPSGVGVAAKRSRHIPAEVKRQVAERDGYQCTYTDTAGRRCPERGLVEFHHVQPFGKDGEHEVTNIRLLCRAHNAGEARHDFGDEVMERWHGHGAHRHSSPTVPGNSWQSSRTRVVDGATNPGNTKDTG